jgi:hypothetical protein
LAAPRYIKYGARFQIYQNRQPHSLSSLQAEAEFFLYNQRLARRLRLPQGAFPHDCNEEQGRHPHRDMRNGKDFELTNTSSGPRTAFMAGLDPAIQQTNGNLDSRVKRGYDKQ